MGSAIAGILTVGILTCWHLRTRRHPGWRVSSDGRSYITVGQLLVMVAVYWLVSAPTATAWEWALGNAWALVAMVSIVYGFNALRRSIEDQQHASEAIESIDPAADDARMVPDQDANGSTFV